MNLKKLKTNNDILIEGLYLIEPDIFEDKRGSFYESWNAKLFNEIIGKEINFLQDNHSSSIKGVLRGLHYQLNPVPQAKLIRCIKGEIYDVAIDLRKDSITFGKWASVTLNQSNRKQFWIPEGFAHGFLTVSKYAEVLYKATNYWNKDLERTINWDDPKILIEWPLKSINFAYPLLSEKDQNGISFDQAINNFEIF